MIGFVSLLHGCGPAPAPPAVDSGLDAYVADPQHPCCVSVPNFCGGEPGQEQPLPFDELFCALPFDCDAPSVQAASIANGCRVIAPLSNSHLAQHLDVALLPDEVILVSGYDRGHLPGSSYGDLVVGRAVSEGGVVSPITWSSVDGVPSAAVSPVSGITPDHLGWRGGVYEAGDDVGEWSSLDYHAASAVIRLSYYDRTRGALRFASQTSASAPWSQHEVYGDADSGRHSSLAQLADGRPTVAFWIRTGTSDAGTWPQGAVAVATANTLLPQSAADWSVSSVAGSEAGIPCEPELCLGSLVCLASGSCAAASDAPAVDCTHVDAGGATRAACAVGDLCVEEGVDTFACAAPFQPASLRVDPAVSLRASPDGLALAWFHPGAGTLYGSLFDGAWRAPFVVDGLGASEGVAGAFATLVVEPDGTWQVAYVDSEPPRLALGTLAAATLSDPSPAVVVTTIDDGGGSRAPSGDVDFARTAAGELRVVYRDALARVALLARRPAGEASWVLQTGGDNPALDSRPGAGEFVAQAISGETSYIAVWQSPLAETEASTRLFVLP